MGLQLSKSSGLAPGSFKGRRHNRRHPLPSRRDSDCESFRDPHLQGDMGAGCAGVQPRPVAAAGRRGEGEVLYSGKLADFISAGMRKSTVD